MIIIIIIITRTRRRRRRKGIPFNFSTGEKEREGIEEETIRRGKEKKKLKRSFFSLVYEKEIIL